MNPFARNDVLTALTHLILLFSAMYSLGVLLSVVVIASPCISGNKKASK